MKKIFQLFLLFLLAMDFPSLLPYSDERGLEQKSRISEALQALDYWSEQRAYPHKSIPDPDFYRAFKFTNPLLKKEEMDSISDRWQSIGPDNRGGRTIALAVDPNNPDIVYAGSASGGLWRLTFHELRYSWEYIDTGFPVLGVNAIAIDPNNSDVIYIGTGEVYGYQNSIGGLYIRTTRGSYGIGLLKTTDGGKTWVKSIDWSYQQRRGVLSLELNPLRPEVVFAGTTEGTFKSSDGGSSWTIVDSTLMVVDVAINPVDTNIVYISCGNLFSPGTGIYRSMESGKKGTWEKLTHGLPPTWGGKALLDIYKKSPNILYASIGNGYTGDAGTWLCKSVDSGENWTVVNKENYSSYQGWFAHYVRVNPEDENKLMCAGVDFYLSSDGGKTLRRYTGQDVMHVDHHVFANHPTNPNIVYFGNDGGVYRTLNGGNSFQELNDGYITSQFYNGFSSSPLDSNHALGGLQDNSTVRYFGNKGWITGLIGGDGGFTAINTINDDIVFGSWQHLHILRSFQRGERNSWQNIWRPLEGDESAFIAPFVLAPSTPEVLYAGKEIIYRSNNYGSNWYRLNNGQPLNGNPALAIAVSPFNPNVVYVATVPKEQQRAEVFVSRDGGGTWSNITGNLPDRYYVDLVVSPDNEDVVYITLSGFGTSHLYRTEDGGDTWDDIGRGLPDLPTSAVAIDPEIPHHIYVGNDLGVYVSTDNGNTWQEWKEGMPTATLVMDLSISVSNRKIRAVTHGNGVYERRLLQPSEVTSPPPPVESFVLQQNYPNPFQGETEIHFRLKFPAFISLIIYNSLGQKVRTLVAKSYKPGNFTVQWDGRDGFGKPVPQGIYFYSMKRDNYFQTKKMLLLR